MKTCRLLYISKVSFQSSRTHVYNIARTCEALQKQGTLSVTLVSIDMEPSLHSFFERHHVEVPYEVIGLGMNFPGDVGRLMYGIWLLKVNVRICSFLYSRRHAFDVVYTRDETLFLASFFARLLNKRLFYEVHSVLVGWHRQLQNIFLIKISTGVIAISEQLKRYYSKLHRRIIVSYCGADESYWVENEQSREVLRKRLSLPTDAFIIGYAGVLGPNPNGDVYEVDDVIRSLQCLPRDCMCVIIGEQNNNADWLRSVAREHRLEDRVLILPWQERAVVPQYLRSFDVIAVPRRKLDLASDSPLKMFTALSVGLPIVAGNSRAVTEVLNDGVNAKIVLTNTPSGWAEAIRMIYDNETLAKELAVRALQDSKQYTWESRGIVISDFICS